MLNAAETHYHSAVNEVGRIGDTGVYYDAAGNLGKDAAGEDRTIVVEKLDEQMNE